MTFPVERELSCPICKTTSTFEIILSTNQFGSCDLDTRPPEMMRSTINSWVQACPSCNYVATQFTDPPTVDAEFLKTENYVNCDGIPFSSELAKNFYRLYLIKKHDNEPEQAFTEVLHAAWACDDAGDEEYAVKARRIAIAALDLWDKNDEEKETYSLIKIDLLRRTRDFAQAIENAKAFTSDQEILRKIVAAQIELCEKEDDSCHTVADVINEE